MFNALAKNASNVLVPFPEHHCAINGLFASGCNAKIHTSIAPSHKALFKERAAECPGDVYISEKSPMSPLSALTELSETDALEYYQLLITSRYKLDVVFYDYRLSKGDLARYAVHSDCLIIISLSDSSELASELSRLPLKSGRRAICLSCESFCSVTWGEALVIWGYHAKSIISRRNF